MPQRRSGDFMDAKELVHVAILPSAPLVVGVYRDFHAADEAAASAAKTCAEPGGRRIIAQAFVDRGPRRFTLEELLFAGAVAVVFGMAAVLAIFWAFNL
jgi:hypothetical protein